MMSEEETSASGIRLVARSLLARSRQVWRSPLLLPLALFLVSLGTALRIALRWTDGRLVYALDDAYIHMAVAKTLASHGIWGCTPFHFSSSSSSLLWTFGLGVAYRAFQVHDCTPLVLNVAFAIGTLVVADVSLARFGAPPVLRASALLGIVVAFPLSGMALMGMEHILHLLLTIGFAAVAVEALTRPSESPRVERRRTVALCILGALLGASRYEGFFLIGLACLAFLVRRQLRRAVSTGVAALLPVAVFGAISAANGSYFLPNPLMVKAVGETASTVSALLKPFGSEDLAFLQNNRAMPILIGLGVLGALAHGRARRGFWRPPVLLPLLLVAMILLHGHFVFSPLYWAYRYDAYLVGFGIFVAAVVLVEMPAPRAFPRGALPALLVASLVPIIADVREGLVPDAEIEGMRGTYLEQYQTAQFIQRYYPGATRDRQRPRRGHLLHAGANPGSRRVGRPRAARDHATCRLHEPRGHGMDDAVPALDRDRLARLGRGRPADPSRVGEGRRGRSPPAPPSRRLLRRRPEGVLDPSRERGPALRAARPDDGASPEAPASRRRDGRRRRAATWTVAPPRGGLDVSRVRGIP